MRACETDFGFSGFARLAAFCAMLAAIVRIRGHAYWTVVDATISAEYLPRSHCTLRASATILAFTAEGTALVANAVRPRNTVVSRGTLLEAPTFMKHILCTRVTHRTTRVSAAQAIVPTRHALLVVRCVRV